MKSRLYPTVQEFRKDFNTQLDWTTVTYALSETDCKISFLSHPLGKRPLISGIRTENAFIFPRPEKNFQIQI